MLYRLLVVSCLMVAACGHKPASTRARVAEAAPAKDDPAWLNDVDVRLLTEALAYDVTHSPWLQGLQAVQGAADAPLPQVKVGAVPERVPPSDAPFPRTEFTQHLLQSLRNTHRVDVAPLDAAAGAAAAAPTRAPSWQLDVTATHDTVAIEGDMSRGYRLDAVLRLCPNRTTAWEKSYTLRKRIRPEAQDGDSAPRS